MGHKCAYTHTYSDAQTGATREYSCPRPCQHSGIHCVFHSEEGVDDSDAREAFMDEMRSISDGSDDDPVLFIGCRIPSVSVADIDTKRSVYFTDARFSGDVAFSGIRCRAADFTDAKFAGSLSMADMVADAVRLLKTSFSCSGGAAAADDVDAVGSATVELERCDFRSCNVALASMPSARFSECTIGDAVFRYSEICDFEAIDCSFEGDADFAEGKIGVARFDGVSFGGGAVFEGAAGSTVFEKSGSFRHARFGREEQVRFGRSLSNVSFLGTNMTRVRFHADTVWNDDGNRYAILDERRLAEDPSPSALSDALAVYRSLRECYEYWLMYVEAGQFYAREIDMRRRYRLDARRGKVVRSRWHRYLSLANGYNVLCRYGESFGRASAWVGGVFAASAAYFMCADAGPQGSPDGLYLQAVAALERTLAAFLHTGKGGIDDHVVRIVSLPVLGSMFIVLKRRLERRLRH